MYGMNWFRAARSHIFDMAGSKETGQLLFATSRSPSFGSGTTSDIFQEAFDSIHHAKLLMKLSSLGVSSSALEWFRSYIHDRQQYIRIGSEMSGMCKSTHGVLQGSILGPALFNVYINDLLGVPDYCFLESYMDDSKLHLSFLVKDIDR